MGQFFLSEHQNSLSRYPRGAREPISPTQLVTLASDYTEMYLDSHPNDPPTFTVIMTY